MTRVCSDALPLVADTSTRTGPGSDMRPLYGTLAKKYRLLIFSGDSDGCVPFTGSAEWTSGAS